MPLMCAFVGSVRNYGSLFPLPHFSPDLANKACPFALHACRQKAKPRVCRESEKRGGRGKLERQIMYELSHLSNVIEGVENKKVRISNGFGI